MINEIEDLGEKIRAEVEEFYKEHGHLPEHKLFDPEEQWEIKSQDILTIPTVIIDRSWILKK